MNLYNSYWNTYTVVGVAWIGDTSVDCSISTKPNICARVSYFIDWIHDTTGIPRVPRPTTTTTTTTTTPAPTTSYFTCEGKPSGNYPNPACDCCTTFYKCSNGYAYLYVIPFCIHFQRFIRWPANNWNISRTVLMLERYLIPKYWSASTRKICRPAEV